jgi:hypothetical protein
MNCYHLSCGHWVSDFDYHEIGAPYPCRECDRTRIYVIGWTRPAEFTP